MELSPAQVCVQLIGWQRRLDDGCVADPDLGCTNNVQQSIANQTNLSAKVNIFGSPLLEVPDFGSVTYQYRLVVKDDEDKLVNLDGIPTLSLVSATGTDRSAYLSAVSQLSIGQYLWTITISASAAKDL